MVLHATMMKRFEIAELVENLNASNSQVNFFLIGSLMYQPRHLRCLLLVVVIFTRSQGSLGFNFSLLRSTSFSNSFLHLNHHILLSLSIFLLLQHTKGWRMSNIQPA
ncbi:uncharacterized protein LOC124843070 isoform X2 [Vigna umbellata]|uniref:uncharacterized protein LOC124843070 isoform X2 n=1 Tax=Vigna umbellata TaxID=87088 RepID=UPI001F5EA4DC|nr:uncharacterized protein LOC124843070 isoform X2 [Vigna umbellata]